MNLRNFAANRRGSAHCRVPRVMWLAAHLQSCRIASVVAARKRAGTHRLYRYPSSLGRIGSPQSHPPQFFSHEKGFGLFGRVLVMAARRCEKCFLSEPGCSILRGKRKTTSRGITCKSNTRFVLLRLRPSALSRPAVTRRSNRRSWVAGPGRPRPSLSTAAWAPARSSARRPTSPIARHTRRAAEHARRVTDFAQSLTSSAIAVISRDGRFVACASGDALPRPRNGRDDTCSTRS